MKHHLHALAAALVLAGGAHAHISIASGPGFADKSQEISFGVGHGCEGADTWRVRVEIPEGVSSVRAVNTDFGKATVEKDDAGTVVAVVWQKPEELLNDGDTHYYKLTIRAKVPNAPFTLLHFPTHQTCRTIDGTETTVDWVGTGAHGHDEGAEDPAPAMTILPPRLAGWNRFTVPAAIEDLAAMFGDARIVWKGTAAFSSNPLVTEMIGATPGVSGLEALSAGDEIWVLY